MKLEGMTYITKTMDNNIKATEKRLGLKCRKVIGHVNRLGEHIVFGKFGRDEYITLGSFHNGTLLNSLAFNV